MTVPFLPLNVIETNALVGEIMMPLFQNVVARDFSVLQVCFIYYFLLSKVFTQGLSPIDHLMLFVQLMMMGVNLECILLFTFGTGKD